MRRTLYTADLKWDSVLSEWYAICPHCQAELTIDKVGIYVCDDCGADFAVERPEESEDVA